MIPGPSSITDSVAIGAPVPARRPRARGDLDRRCPRGVCVIALSSRMRRICSTRSGSQIGLDVVPSPSATSIVESVRSAAAANSPATSRASMRSGTGSSSSSSEPASSRDRSSRSVVSFWSRSTCSRIVARNSSRVSSSRSSSWSSSTKPPSEKIGVRSSCEALAMNSLRALVDARELALHLVEGARELAELVLGVDRDRRREVAGRDLGGGALEPLDAAREHASRRSSRPVAATISAIDAGDQDLAADQRDVVLRRRRAAPRRPPPTGRLPW